MKRRKHRKKRKVKIIPILACMIMSVGIIICLYPTMSNYLAKKQQENVIVGYEKMLLQMSDNVKKTEWIKAQNFNQNYENYMDVLNFEKNGVMGYIEIPKIDVSIPIYHYANEESLKKGVGHLEHTELPIGGEGNHPVLLGHRGLPDAELFTRLDEIKIGDVFYIYVIDEVLIYEVNQITIVLPEEIFNIKGKDNQDLITLVTCTPYGINTHRLLVTGERVENVEENSEKQEVKTAGKSKLIIYVMVILAGAAIVLYPYMTHRSYSNRIERQKKLYFHHVSNSGNRMEKLYDELLRRNEKLYLDGQKNLSGPEVYKASTINLKIYGINNNIIGYIAIPKMKIELPIILGASEENMKKGAVHLTETSYPVGGKNTNCVIAAHRGYSKTAMFRDIEKMEIGDYVYVNNFKERLIYRVTQLRIIMPSDIEQILIQEGKDMLTLLTCHPYRKNSQRYVVFCERI